MKLLGKITFVLIFCLFVSCKSYVKKTSLQKGELENRVNQVIEVVKKRSTKSFLSYVKNVNKLINDEGYIFVLGIDGKILVHKDPNLVGKNSFELIDKETKTSIGKSIVNAVKDKPKSWVNYSWEGRIKSSLIFKHKGIIIGGGFFK